MTSQSNSASECRGWLSASGLPELFRVGGMAIHPAKIGLALGAIVATFLYGGILDWLWLRGGGVPSDAIERYSAARMMHTAYAEGEGDRGIFQTWREHQRHCLTGLLGSWIPGSGAIVGAHMTGGVAPMATGGPLGSLTGMVHGALWLIRHHVVFAIVFGAGALLIWSLAGGAICRLAAVQFARGEKPTAMQGLSFARGRLFGGFFLAPCIPLASILIVAVVMAVGGVVLRIPFVGDLFSVLFMLALIGGGIAALLCVGLLAGGSLFWPVVAAEGSDAFDAFSRGLAYPFSRPLRTAWYYLVTLLYAGVCWFFVNVFVFVALSLTRGIVSWGTSPFGWWSREAGGSRVSKLDLLWPAGPGVLHSWPEWSQLGYFERFAALAVGVNVLLAIGATWAFLASFYFCGGTVMYFLLRRDVDGADLGEVLEGDEPGETGGTAGAPSGTSRG